ncbi:prohibitin family protein [Niastella populi]|uniref:Band 7 protein n=1 Tax=Niastella populi TaxID=550983 RepID=A0A1V9EHN3_9BACT|nr:prohibitin family protein [Niastella populi]OQP45650.1 band 7 protein [Niastella populi]
MALIIIGIIVFLVGLAIVRNSEWNYRYRRFSLPIRIIGGIIILIGVLISCVIQIEAGEVGVKKLFGKVQNDVLSSGLHFINPLLVVEEMDVKTQNYTMSGVHDEGQKSNDDAIRALTADGLEVIIDLTVLYRVLPADAPNIVREIGLNYTDKVVRPLTRTKIRDNAVYYEAVSLYSSKRDEFQARIFKSIETDFKSRGLVLEQLLVRNITLPQMVKTAIEQKITAEQDAQKMQFVLAKERQEAERKRVEAQGISDYQRIINESLTDRQLQYEQIKAMKDLAASGNAKMVIMGRGNTPVILDAKQ